MFCVIGLQNIPPYESFHFTSHRCDDVAAGGLKRSLVIIKKSLSDHRSVVIDAYLPMIGNEAVKSHMKLNRVNNS